MTRIVVFTVMSNYFSGCRERRRNLEACEGESEGEGEQGNGIS